MKNGKISKLRGSKLTGRSPIHTLAMKFLELYSIPGEGLIAAFEERGDTLLFDKQGLQSRIISLKHQGKDSSQEELGLSRMSSISQQQHETIF